MVSGAKRTHKADMHGHLAFAVVQARKQDPAVQWSVAKWNKLSKDLHVQVSGVALSQTYSNFVTNDKAKFNKLLVMPAIKFAVTTLVETFNKNPALLQLMSDGFGGHARIAAVCSTNVDRERVGFATQQLARNVAVRKLGVANSILKTQQVLQACSASVCLGNGQDADERRTLDSLSQDLFNGEHAT
jgi:hypothetical protein